MARKSSAAGQGGRSRGDNSTLDSIGAYSGPSLSFPLTFVLTPIEAHHIQKALSKVGLAKKPQCEISTTNPPTPTPSYPSTPVSGLAPKNSPFQSLSSINDSLDQSTSQQNVKPSLSLALQNAFNDDVLPLASRSALRAFLLGWFVNYTMDTLVPTVMQRKTPRRALSSVMSVSHQRIGTSLALFAFLYRTISYLLTFIRFKALSSLPNLAPSLMTASTRVRLLSRLVRLLQGNSVVAFLATLLASSSLIILPSQESKRPGAKTFPRKTLALSLFTGGLQIQYNVMRKRRNQAVNWIPNWCDSALLYAIGNGQLLWSFLFEPDCFPQSYGNIILARSSAYIPSRPEDLPSAIPWPSRRIVADHVALLSTPTKQSSAYPSFISPSLSALQPLPFPTTSYPAINSILDFSPAHPAHSQLLCALLHPTEPSCKRNFIKFWVTEWKASARFISIFLAFFNLLKWKSWKRDPEGSIFQFAMGVIQGATVVSGSIGTAWSLTCAFQYYFPRNVLPKSRYLLNGFLSSIFIFAVPAARRAQLGLYVGRLSLDSSWQILKKHNRVKPVRNGDVVLLALGLAMLNSMREDVPSELRGYLRRVCSGLTGARLSTSKSYASAGLPIELSPKSTSSSQWLSPSTTADLKFHLTQASLEERSKSKAN